MWRLWRTATGTHSRPSRLVGIRDRWAAYMFDAAVVFFGNAIENAAQEQINVGGEEKPRYVAKYTLVQLLTPGFVIEADADDGDELPFGADGMIYDEVG